MVFYVLRIHKTKLKRRLRNLPSFSEGLSVRIFVREIQEDDATGKGYWRMAKVLNQIFSNKIIAKLGYTSMLDYYLVVYEN